jgi:hypothetical protein
VLFCGPSEAKSSRRSRRNVALNGSVLLAGFTETMLGPEPNPQVYSGLGAACSIMCCWARCSRFAKNSFSLVFWSVVSTS